MESTRRNLIAETSRAGSFPQAIIAGPGCSSVVQDVVSDVRLGLCTGQRIENGPELPAVEHAVVRMAVRTYGHLALQISTRAIIGCGASSRQTQTQSHTTASAISRKPSSRQTGRPRLPTSRGHDLPFGAASRR